MKKSLKFSAMVLACAILCSSCIGSFQLTNKLKDYNDGIGSKFVNELVFLAFCIVPVYEVTLLVDAVVLNSIEFWTGNNLVAEPGETKIVKNAQGVDVQVTALENGYTISDGKTAMNLIYDENILMEGKDGESKPRVQFKEAFNLSFTYTFGNYKKK